MTSVTPKRSYVGKVLRSLLARIPPAAVVRVLSGPLRGARWVRGAGVDGYWIGTYEAKKQRLFARHVRPGGVVFDVGAHVGLYTLIAARRVGPAGHVYAFEPFPDNVRHLAEHLRLNGVENVSIMETAVTDHAGSVSFVPGLDSFTGKVSTEGAVTVQSASLDGMLASGQVCAPDLIKMDVEGAEFGALAGAQGLLAAKRPVIFLAVHSPELRARCLEFLGRIGYDLQPLDTAAAAEAYEFLAVRSAS